MRITKRTGVPKRETDGPISDLGMAGGAGAIYCLPTCKYQGTILDPETLKVFRLLGIHDTEEKAEAEIVSDLRQ